MNKLGVLFLIFCCTDCIIGQELYFPPIGSNIWETISASELSWCEDKIDDLYSFLDEQDTKAFIILKDGKIVLERYFDNFTADSVWYWASAGKTLTALTVGVAQREGFLHLENSTSEFLGTGWTNCSAAEEDRIKIVDQLRMTSGLNDQPDPFCTDPGCLECIAEPGIRWSYHNAPYTLLDRVLSEATGRNLNIYINQKIGQPTGITGLFIKLGFNNIFFSTPRSMARFGLLILNRGVWNGNDILQDAEYFEAMVNTSQQLNPSYGYLWWLNGKDKFMLPSSQIVFDGPLFPSAPEDLIAALGANGQVINVVPSKNLVIIRMGNSPDSNLIANLFTDRLWERLNEVMCETSSSHEQKEDISYKIYPNPSRGEIRIETKFENFNLKVFNISGREMKSLSNLSFNIRLYLSDMPKGVYFLELINKEGLKAIEKVIIN